MAGSFLRGAIALGWLVMTSGLVLRELSPLEDAQRIPLRTVIEQIFNGGHHSALEVFRNGRALGRVEFRPSNDNGTRTAAFNAQIGFPLPSSGRVEWTVGGETNLDSDLQPISGRFWAAAEELQQRITGRFDTATDFWEFKLGDPEAALFEISGTPHEIVEQLTALAAMVAGPEAAELLRRETRPPPTQPAGSVPIVYAARARLPYAGHEIEGSRIVIELAPGLRAQLFVTSVGQILQVRTSMEFQLFAPVLHGIEGIDHSPLPDR